MNETMKKPAENQTAADLYAIRKADIGILLDLIKRKLKDHATQAAHDPRNWGLTGDLGYIRSELKTILSFLTLKGSQSEEGVDRMIEEQIEEMRKE